MTPRITNFITRSVGILLSNIQFYWKWMIASLFIWWIKISLFITWCWLLMQLSFTLVVSIYLIYTHSFITIVYCSGRRLEAPLLAAGENPWAIETDQDQDEDPVQVEGRNRRWPVSPSWMGLKTEEYYQVFHLLSVDNSYSQAELEDWYRHGKLPGHRWWKPSSAETNFLWTHINDADSECPQTLLCFKTENGIRYRLYLPQHLDPDLFSAEWIAANRLIANSRLFDHEYTTMYDMRKHDILRVSVLADSDPIPGDPFGDNDYVFHHSRNVKIPKDPHADWYYARPGRVTDLNELVDKILKR